MSQETGVVGSEDIRQTVARAVADCRAYCLERAAAAPGERAALYRRLWDERWPLVKQRALEAFAERNPMAARFTDVLAQLGRLLELDAGNARARGGRRD